MSPTSRHRSRFVALAVLLGLAALAGPGNERALARPPEVPVERPLPSPEEIAKLPPDGGPEFNRLIFETSPYLLQHARNPVNWYPWGEEAFAAARDQGKPVFLSIGYSTCHWCHVMEHESFESEQVAKLLNDKFIAVKVDREERPDIDQIYMTATQLVTQRGGWPNSVFLTPKAKPFYAGTYFPREAFIQILGRVAEAWASDRDRLEEDANHLSEAIYRQTVLPPGAGAQGPLDRSVVDGEVDGLRTSFDETQGGFGGSPKFPPCGSLAILLYEFERTGDSSLVPLITRTLDAMAAGGIHDHVGGGFHRYSTDARWFLPHFEKMLYDNAQLAEIYAEASRRLQQPRWEAVARDTYDWVLRDMTDKEGGFYSALDADSEGEEGKFYLWNQAEVEEVLGADEGALFCRIYHVTDEGTYHEEASGRGSGSSIPVLDATVEEVAGAEGVKPAQLADRLAHDREALRKKRDQRVWPHLDDKVQASWNGLMIGSLARGGELLGEKRYTRAAERAASFVLDDMRNDDGRLLHTWRAGEARIAGYLDDYAFMADGLLDLYDATGNKRWREAAVELVGIAREDFTDLHGGGLYFSGAGHEALLAPSKDPFDQAMPSANGKMALVLVRLAAERDDAQYLESARAILDDFRGLMKAVPRGTESLILAAAQYFDLTQPAQSAPAVVAEKEKTEEAEGAAPAGAAGGKAASVGGDPDARVRRGHVTADLFASRLVVAPGDRLDVAVRLATDDGWHVNSHQPLQEYLVPTTVTLAGESKARLKDVEYPPGREARFPYGDEAISVYDGEVWIRAHVEVPSRAEDAGGELRLRVNVQPCDDRACLAPDTLTLAMPLVVDRQAAELAGDVRRHPDVFP